MSNTFKKTSLRGFTLIELLVVIAIIGLLSTAIMGPVQTGLKKGRDTRKISDITQVQGALLQYAGDNSGAYPSHLWDLAPTYMATDTKMFDATTATNEGLNPPALRDKFMYVTYADLASILVSYHLGVALENQNASLQADVDCGDTITAAVIDEATPLAQTVSGGSGDNVPCTQGLDGGVLDNSNYDASGAGNPAATANTEDFGGSGSAEAANGVCTSALTSCIFDVQPK